MDSSTSSKSPILRYVRNQYIPKRMPNFEEYVTILDDVLDSIKPFLTYLTKDTVHSFYSLSEEASMTYPPEFETLKVMVISDIQQSFGRAATLLTRDGRWVYLETTIFHKYIVHEFQDSRAAVIDCFEGDTDLYFNPNHKVEIYDRPDLFSKFLEHIRMVVSLTSGEMRQRSDSLKKLADYVSTVDDLLGTLPNSELPRF